MQLKLFRMWWLPLAAARRPPPSIVPSVLSSDECATLREFVAALHDPDAKQALPPHERYSISGCVSPNRLRQSSSIRPRLTSVMRRGLVVGQQTICLITRCWWVFYRRSSVARTITWTQILLGRYQGRGLLPSRCQVFCVATMHILFGSTALSRRSAGQDSVETSRTRTVPLNDTLANGQWTQFD